MTPDLEAAILAALTTNGPAQAYAKGYEAGLPATQAPELELVAGVFTAAQEARADAIHAAVRCFQTSLGTTEGEDDLLFVTQSVLEMACSFAHYIEHGHHAADFYRHVDEALDVVRGADFDQHTAEAIRLVNEARGAVRAARHQVSVADPIAPVSATQT